MFDAHIRQSFGRRLVAAARLQLPVYVEVSTDRATSIQAAIVVLLVGMCNGVGLIQRLSTFGIVAGVTAAIVGWFLWTGVISSVAVLLRAPRQGRSLLRALGFANAPGVLLGLGIVPAIGPLLRAVVVGWLLAATAVAVQAVFAVSRWRAWLITLCGFVLYLLVGIASAHWVSTL